jgi:hypothetical protein
MVWMEKIIGEHGEIREFLKFKETDYTLIINISLTKAYEYD